MSTTEQGRVVTQELFQETEIKGVGVANRFVYSATWDGLADDGGFCTPRAIDMLVQRARGGVGLLISGMAFVTLDGRAAPWQLAAYDDQFVPGLTEMAKAVHEAHGKVFLQWVLCPDRLNRHRAFRPLRKRVRSLSPLPGDDFGRNR